MANNNYFPEIDGLRAIAVLSVVIFHAGVESLSGGFIGVDIFYVISGYLITGLITKSIINKDFSFEEFYIRRLKRLLPAAVFLITTTVVIGSLFLTKNSYIELSKSAIYSNLFIANVWFMNNSGYFDLATQVSPLVHMWSLSVEEQFYIIFPFLLFISYRLGKVRSIVILIFFIIIASLIGSIYLSEKHPNFSFYMLATRAWELAIGGAIIFIPSLKTNQRILFSTITFSGLTLLTYSLISLSENDIYPGHLAILPVTGSALIIYSLVNSRGILNKILSTKPFQLVGKSSYSVYLWHWPIVVYYRIYINERQFNMIEVISLTLTSLLAGYLSWKYIEEKFRRISYSNSRTIILSASAVGISLALSSLVYISSGFPERISESEIALTDNRVMWEFECTDRIKIFEEIEDEFCIIGHPWNNSDKKGIIWGDSHSLHWAQTFHREAIRNNMSMIIAPERCPPYLISEIVKEHYPKFPNFTSNCTKRNLATLKWIKNQNNIDLIVMASAWSGHVRMLYTSNHPTNKSNLPIDKKSDTIGANLSLTALEHLISKLDGINILILGDIPRPNKVMNGCAASEKTMLVRQNCDGSRYKYIKYSEIEKWHKRSNNVLMALSENNKNVETIIPSDFLCDDEHCPTYINGEFIYKDENHIRRNLKNQTIDMLSEKIGIGKFLSSI